MFLSLKHKILMNEHALYKYSYFICHNSMSGAIDSENNLCKFTLNYSMFVFKK